MKRLCEDSKVNNESFKTRRVEGDDIKNREVNSNNAQVPRVILPADNLKIIFEYFVEDSSEPQKFLKLLRLTEVCKCFNIIVKEIIGQKLISYNKSDINLSLLFIAAERAPIKWTVPAAYYTFAHNFLNELICDYSLEAKHLSQMCDKVIKDFEALLASFSVHTIKKINDDFDVMIKMKIIKFNLKSNASISALNILIPNTLLTQKIFDLCFDEELLNNLIAFLHKNNSKESFSTIIQNQVKFLCDHFITKPFEAVTLLNYFINRDLIEKHTITYLMQAIFKKLLNLGSGESHMFTLLCLLVKKKIIELSIHAIKFFKTSIFQIFENNPSMHDNDRALFLFQELTAANYSLNLNPREISLLKEHALQRLFFFNVDFNTNILESLSFLSPISSLNLSSQASFDVFHMLRKEFIAKAHEYKQPEKQRLIKIFKLFSQHPQDQINLLANHICIVLEQGISVLKEHAFSILFSNLSTLIQKDLAIQILHEILASNHPVELDDQQLKELKAYATTKFAEDSLDLFFMQNLIKLFLDSHILPQELFPITTLQFFKGVHTFITSSKQQYAPLVAQQLTNIYQPFLGHTDEQIVHLSKEICLAINEGLKNHALLDIKDFMVPIKQKDSAVLTLQNLLASNYLLNLDHSEVQILKTYAIERFNNQEVDLLLMQNFIGLLSTMINTDELLPIVSLKFFQDVYTSIKSNPTQYTPLIADKLSGIYKVFLNHFNKEIVLLAHKILIHINTYTISDKIK